jgi:hypothetical protein
MNADPHPSRLDADEAVHYRSEGWVIPRFRLPAAEVDALREALDALMRNNPGVRPEKLVSAHIEGDNGEGVRGSAASSSLRATRASSSSSRA